MARDREVNIIVDAQNKARGAFLEVRRGLEDMGRSANTNLSAMNNHFRNSDSAIYRFSDRLQFMDRIAKRTFKGIAGASAIYLAATMRDFAQLEDGISKVNTLYDQTKQSQEKMTKDVINMSRFIPADYTTITQGVYDTISAGADPKDATRISKKFGMASIAGMTEMPVVTKAAMGTMNAFGKEAKDLNHILDIQFLTVKRGITEYSQLASSLDTGVLKAADSAGISMNELYGGIAQITKNAVPAAVATTQLTQIFARLTDPKVIDRFKEFGVNIQDAHHNTRPMIEIVKDLNAQFEKKGLNKTQQAGILKGLLGGRQEAVRGFQILTSQIDDYEKVVNEMDHADGTMLEAFKDKLDAITTQVKLLWNNFKADGVEQIEALKPFLDAITEPLKQKQTLSFEKETLQEELENTKDPKQKGFIRERIAEIELEIKNMDLTPVEEFRKGLEEGVAQLERINPPLAKFVDTIGSFTLGLVGEEGKTQRDALGVIGQEILGLYAFKKIVDGVGWFNKNFRRNKTNGNAGEDLARTLQTMNVNANIVNVYGKVVNGGKGGNPASPNTPTSNSPSGSSVASSRNLLPSPTGSSVGGSLVGSATKTMLALKGVETTAKFIGSAGQKLLSGGLTKGNQLLLSGGSTANTTGKIITEAMKNGAIDLVEVTTSEAATAFKAGSGILIAGVITLAKEAIKNYKSEDLLKNTGKQWFDYTTNDYKVGKKEDINKKYEYLNSIPSSFSANKSNTRIGFTESKVQPDARGDKVISSLLKNLKESFKLDQKIDLKNEVKVDAPKVTNRIYIDGKSIPIQRVETSVENIGKQVERDSRRYSGFTR